MVVVKAGYAQSTYLQEGMRLSKFIKILSDDITCIIMMHSFDSFPYRFAEKNDWKPELVPLKAGDFI